MSRPSSQLSEGRSYRDSPYYGFSRNYRQSDQQGAYSDWDRAWDRSGGGCCCGGGGYSGDSLSSFSDGTLFALLAAAGLAFYVLYTTVTAAAGTGKRKRSARVEDEESGFGFEDLLFQGRLKVSLTSPLTRPTISFSQLEV